MPVRRRTEISAYFWVIIFNSFLNYEITQILHSAAHAQFACWVVFIGASRRFGREGSDRNYIHVSQRTRTTVCSPRSKEYINTIG